MLFERIEDTGLSQFSYAVGDPAAGAAAIIDPRRDVDVYIELAERRGLRITHVLETHIHADYASGAHELAQRTGAEHLVSGHDEGETYVAAFPHRDLFDGDTVEVGSVRLEALHTPGHTPEHLAFLVHDSTRSTTEPFAMLSGDFLFVGSLGRPDLLGEAAKQRLAERLFDSVRQRLAGLPDALEVHPGHGAGSMCGSGMSGRPTSTLGSERFANPYLDPQLTRQAFVELLLARVPPFPDYYLRMKRLNADGPPPLGPLPGLTPIPAERFATLVDTGEATVVDLRDSESFGRGHVAGSFGIGTAGSLSVWASWVVPYDRPILLVTEDPNQVEMGVRALIRVGLDQVLGYLDGGMDAWHAATQPTSDLPQLSPWELRNKLVAGEPIHVLDVRSDEEWASAHITGAQHVMGGHLPQRLDELPDDGQPIAVVCNSGYRSTVAASVLQRAGRDRVLNLAGGMQAWNRADLPVEKPQ